MTIGQLSNISGIPTKTIRYYELRKLIAKPKTRESGYRIYNDDYVVRLDLIKNAKALGFTLKEIKYLIESDDCKYVCEFSVGKLEEISNKIKELKVLEKKLRQLIKKCTNETIVENCTVYKTLSPKTERRSK